MVLILKKLLAAIFLVFFATTALAVKVSVLDYDPLPAQAGEFVDVFLSIENNQEGTSGDVEIELIPKDSLRLAFGQEAVKDIGLIFGNKSSVVKYRLEVTPDAVDGENFFEVIVREEMERDLSFDLSIEVENKQPSIEIGVVESEPAKLLPDTDDVKISVTLLNTGEGIAENLKTRLVLPQVLEFSESFSNTGLVGNLAPNSSSTIDFLIDIPQDTPAGVYKVELVAEYTLEHSASSDFMEKKLYFDIVVKPVPRLKIVSFETTPQILSAGDRAVKLKLVIQNTGEADAESVRVKVFQKSEQPFEFEKIFDFVAPKLEPGEAGEATLEFRVEDNANVQKYLIDLELRSFIDNEVRLEDGVVELNVVNGEKKNPDFLFLGIAGLIGVLVVAAFYWRRLSNARSQTQKKKLNN